jgi:pimeloyl-ACP methyl ester carboxylesterase
MIGFTAKSETSKLGASMRKFLRRAGLGLVAIVALALVMALAVYLRLAMRGPSLSSADPSAVLVEKACPSGVWGARCGVVTAPLDYENVAGRKIEIGFIYFPAVGFGTDRNVALQMIGGGPGFPVTYDAIRGPIWPARLAMRQRALLFVDARGIGLSTRLECPSYADHPVSSLDPDVVAACAADIAPQARHWSTPNTARDFDLVRRALGIDKLDLLAFSYGTSLAPTYAHLFPDKVRTMTLDGAFPMTSWASFMPTYYDGMKREIALFCQRSGQCTSGEVMDALSWAAAELRAHPRVLTPPRDGDRVFPKNVILDAKALAGLMSDIPMRTPAEGSDPAMWRMQAIGGVLKARANGDWRDLEAQAIDLSGHSRKLRIEAGSTFGLNLAVSCRDWAVPWDKSAPPDERRRQLAQRIGSIPMARFAPFTPEEWALRGNARNYYPMLLNCPIQSPDLPNAGLSPFQSTRRDLPVLIMNGDYDMQTPNEDAAAAARQFARVQIAYFGYHGHAITPTSTCAVGLISEFIDTLAVKNPNACYDADKLSASIYAEKQPNK